MALTDAQEKQVIEFLADPAKALKIGELVASSVGEATTTLSKTVEEIAGTVKTLAAAKPEPKAEGDKGKKDKGGETDTPPAWAAELIEANKKTAERLAAMDAEKAQAAERGARQELIVKSLTDLKYSGLAKHNTFVRDLHARGVKTPQEVKAALDEFIADQKALGVEIKPTGASPEGEGAKGAGGAGGAGGDGKTLPLEERIKAVKEISARQTAVPVSVPARG